MNLPNELFNRGNSILRQSFTLKLYGMHFIGISKSDFKRIQFECLWHCMEIALSKDVKLSNSVKHSVHSETLLFECFPPEAKMEADNFLQC